MNMNRLREAFDARPLTLAGNVFAGGCGDTGDCISSPGPSDDDGGGDKRKFDVRNTRAQRSVRQNRVK